MSDVAKQQRILSPTSLNLYEGVTPLPHTNHTSACRTQWVLILKFLSHTCWNEHFKIKTTRDFSEIQISVLLIMIICETPMFILNFWFLEIKIYPFWNSSFKNVRSLQVPVRSRQNSRFDIKSKWIIYYIWGTLVSLVYFSDHRSIMKNDKYSANN